MNINRAIVTKVRKQNLEFSIGNRVIVKPGFQGLEVTSLNCQVLIHDSQID